MNQRLKVCIKKIRKCSFMFRMYFQQITILILLIEEKSTELKDFCSNSNAIKVIIEILTELSSKMDESNMTLDRIVRKLLPEEDILTWPKDMPPLPLKTLNALDRMEDFLESSANFSCMVCA